MQHLSSQSLILLVQAESKGIISRAIWCGHTCSLSQAEDVERGPQVLPASRLQREGAGASSLHVGAPVGTS